MTSHKKTAPATHCIHANLVVYKGKGILITGSSGSGKSTLSYEIIKQGGMLVADDMVRLTLDNGALIGSLPNTDFAGVLHHRQYGFIDITKTFGHDHVISRCAIHYIAALTT